MARISNMVKINVDYVCEYIERNGMTQTEFAAKLGYTQAWLHQIKNRSQSVKPMTFQLMCDTFGFDRDKLIAKPEPEDKPEPKPLYADDELISALANTLYRLERKVDKLLEIWGENN